MKCVLCLVGDKMLTDEHKETRLCLRQRLLQQNKADGDAHLLCIITTDETFIQHYIGIHAMETHIVANTKKVQVVSK